MKTKVAAIYGKRDVRLREFELPEITDNELLVSVISDSVCLSTWKAALLGSEHKRVPDDLENHPVITGHECAGVIVEVGKNLTGKYKKGQRFVLQPAMGLPSGYSAGYSYEYFGGNATYMIIPEIAINLGCVLPYHGSYFAAASLAEPMCCIIGAYHANYHTTQYVYEHRMGVKPGGNIALLACAGPMGIGAIDYASVQDFASCGLLFKYGDERVWFQHTFICHKALKMENREFKFDIEAARKQGLCTIIYEDCIDGRHIAKWFVEQAKNYRIRNIVCDDYRKSILTASFAEVGLPLNTVRSGPITHSKVFPLIETLFATEKIIFGDDMMMRWYTNNVYVDTDGKGNKTYMKIEPRLRKTDGFFAFMHAMSKDEEIPVIQQRRPITCFAT